MFAVLVGDYIKRVAEVDEVPTRVVTIIQDCDETRVYTENGRVFDLASDLTMDDVLLESEV